jgi:hypothetical protein
VRWGPLHARLLDDDGVGKSFVVQHPRQPLKGGGSVMGTATKEGGVTP